jgi:CRISPR-associated protein Cmr4
MSGVLLGLLADTSIHVGVGQGDGAIDLPVAREGGTRHPHAPGSGVKGALREETEARGDDAAQWKERGAKWFGSPAVGADDGAAGEVLVGDMRLLLLPVRTLAGFYEWLTCPYLVERYQRDRARVGLPQGPTFSWSNLTQPAAGDPLPKVLASRQEQIYLEERLFEPVRLPNGLVEFLAGAIAWSDARTRLGDQLAVVSNNDFSWFAEYALPVTAHNKLKETKVSENLWYEETLPPDTVMTLTLADRNNNGAAREAVQAMFFDEPRPYLRVGGNETVGQGWFRVCRAEGLAPTSGRQA